MEEVKQSMLGVLLLAALAIAALIATAQLLVRRHPPRAAAVQRLLDSPAAKVVIVTAHPDDESMFFIPMVRFLRDACGKPRDGVHLLCLSTGNSAGLGEVRSQELREAWSGVLHMPPETLHLVDDPRLPDGLREAWDPEVVSAHVLRTLEHERVRDASSLALVTFDEHGVSGHANHVAVHHGVRLAAARVLGSQSPRPWSKFELWELQSEALWTKYTGPLGLLLPPVPVGFEPRVVHTLVVADGSLSQSCEAMATHASQFVWYRRLFVLFSQYSYRNVLRLAVAGGG